MNSSIALGCSITNGSTACSSTIAKRSKARSATLSWMASKTPCRRLIRRPTGDAIHSRSVTLSSDELQLIAKMDLVEGDGDLVSPVDYKRGNPRENQRDGTLTAWDTDRVQLAVQALVLRENGYRCEEGVIFYVATRQRMRVPIDEALAAETLDALARARRTAESGRMPPPLVDSPKCPRCSLVGVCLPDETRAAAGGVEREQEWRRPRPPANVVRRRRDAAGGRRRRRRR